MKTFAAGGIAIPHRKGLTDSLEIVTMARPHTVIMPLHQHTGAPCQPLVKIGDSVARGQKIGDTDARISAPVHSSISGRVVAVEPRATVHGEVMSVVVEAGDGEKGIADQAVRETGDLGPREIIDAVREAGIVGLGGAAFPTHFKWAVPSNFPVDTVIVNGAECEPYITVDHRLLAERAQEVVLGLSLALKATGAGRGVVAIEVNKPDAIAAVRGALKDVANMDVVTLDTRYPQGAEKMLIKAVLDREVPPRHLPFHAGAVVNNVQTLVAASQAVLRGTPLYEKVITVSGGAVASPGNMMVPIGASFRDILDAAGGTSGQFRLVVGGPMTGVGVENLDLPLTKGVSALLALSPDEYFSGEPGPCIRCARCVDACPMGLVPSGIAAAVERGDTDFAARMCIEDCMECGACAFVCPGHRPLLVRIKEGKLALAKLRAQAS